MIYVHVFNIYMFIISYNRLEQDQTVTLLQVIDVRMKREMRLIIEMDGLAYKRSKV